MRVSKAFQTAGVPGVTTWSFSHLSVGPGCAVSEALGLDAVGAEGEHAGNGSED